VGIACIPGLNYGYPADLYYLGKEVVAIDQWRIQSDVIMPGSGEPAIQQLLPSYGLLLFNDAC